MTTNLCRAHDLAWAISLRDTPFDSMSLADITEALDEAEARGRGDHVDEAKIREQCAAICEGASDTTSAAALIRAGWGVQVPGAATIRRAALEEAAEVCAAGHPDSDVRPYDAGRRDACLDMEDEIRALIDKPAAGAIMNGDET